MLYCPHGALAQLGARHIRIVEAVGSNPICSITCGKEGPGLPGGFLITYADAHPNLFGFRCVCSIICNASEGGIAYAEPIRTKFGF